MLFGAPECVAITIGVEGTLRAVRCVCRRKGAVITAAEVLPPSDAPLAERLKQLGSTIGLRRDHTLVIAPADCGGVFFQTDLPEMPKRELASALAFEAPRHQLSAAGGGDLPQVVFWAIPAAEEGRMTGWAWTAPVSGLEPLWAALREIRWRPDAVMSPYFAIAPLGGAAAGPVRLPEFDPGFYWENGSFHPDDPAVKCNETLKTLLQQELQSAPSLAAPVWEDGVLACVMLASCMLRQERHQPGVRELVLVPPGLRPRRLRSQLRITVFLLTACALLFGGRMAGSVAEHYRQYTSLNASIRQLKTRTTTVQRKLRAREKEQKEMTRILEQNADSRELLILLAELSASLPSSVLASNVRLNETGIDLTLHTNTEDVDLAGSLRHFPSFKVGTLQNRKINDTLTQITLRLRRNQEKK